MLSHFERPEFIAYSRLLTESFTRLTERKLVEAPDISYALYHAPFPVVSHGIESDPIFRYANLKAQELWGVEWEDFVHMPSRLTVEKAGAVERKQ